MTSDSVFGADLSLNPSLAVTNSAGTFIAAMVLIFVYSAIGNCNDERLEILQQAAATNAQEVILPEFPYQNYLHAPDPVDERKLYLFKVFYGIDTDTNVIIDSSN